MLEPRELPPEVSISMGPEAARFPVIVIGSASTQVLLRGVAEKKIMRRQTARVLAPPGCSGQPQPRRDPFGHGFRSGGCGWDVNRPGKRRTWNLKKDFCKEGQVLVLRFHILPPRFLGRASKASYFWFASQHPTTVFFRKTEVGPQGVPLPGWEEGSVAFFERISPIHSHGTADWRPRKTPQKDLPPRFSAVSRQSYTSPMP